MQYTIPVLITIEASDEFHMNKQLQEFLASAFRDYGPTYNVNDYEIEYS